jgi:hypothetical protein
MSVIQKFVSGIVLIGLVTTLILPGRQTVKVINATQSLVGGSLSTAMGTN